MFGTRPEIIKLAPVVKSLEADADKFSTVNVCSGQHRELLRPFTTALGLRVDHDLRVMRPGQTPSDVASRVLSALGPLLARERPDVVLVQGDTTTTMAAALASFHSGIPVGHVEAGLRSGDLTSPFPEEMNRRLVSRLSSLHFAATRRNKNTLVAEGVPPRSIFVTGNPVVDALRALLADPPPAPRAEALLRKIAGLRLIVCTTHRRESHGPRMRENLRVLRRAVDAHDDIALVFPVHPNPSVVLAAREILAGHPRIHLVPPLGYMDFIRLLSECFLIVSDSGGVQEEAPTLGKPLLVLRDNTERPEAIECGVARLVGPRPERFAPMLEDALESRSWARRVSRVKNSPFGDGTSGARIAAALERSFRSRLAGARQQVPA